MASVIYIGRPRQQAGQGFPWKDVVPLALLGALAIGAYYAVKTGFFSNLWPGGTQQTGNPAGSTGTGWSEAVTSFLQNITTPGQYTNPPVSSVAQTGYGYAGDFVSTGAGFPINLFPLGNIITTNQNLTGAEQQQVIGNLCSPSNPANTPAAWWRVQGLCG